VSAFSRLALPIPRLLIQLKETVSKKKLKCAASGMVG
jgi:hypothetical protein